MVANCEQCFRLSKLGGPVLWIGLLDTIIALSSQPNPLGLLISTTTGVLGYRQALQTLSNPANISTLLTPQSELPRLVRHTKTLRLLVLGFRSSSPASSSSHDSSPKALHASRTSLYQSSSPTLPKLQNCKVPSFTDIAISASPLLHILDTVSADAMPSFHRCSTFSQRAPSSWRSSRHPCFVPPGFGFLRIFASPVGISTLVFSMLANRPLGYRCIQDGFGCCHGLGRFGGLFRNAGLAMGPCY